MYRLLAVFYISFFPPWEQYAAKMQYRSYARYVRRFLIGIIVAVVKRRRLGNLDGNSDSEVHDGWDLSPENAECAESTCHVAKLNTPLDTR